MLKSDAKLDHNSPQSREDAIRIIFHEKLNYDDISTHIVHHYNYRITDTVGYNNYSRPNR